MTGINVKSEIGPLKKVFLHRPGNELLNLTPDTLEDLLFDDIPFLRVAQEEHDAFAKILQDEGVEVYYIENLVAEVLGADPKLCEEFLRQWIYEAGVIQPLQQKAVFNFMVENYKEPLDLVRKTIEGIQCAELNIDHIGALDDYVGEQKTMLIDPMPNLYFTRDNFASIGRGVSINHMYSHTRNRETIYGDYIFKHHPMFGDVPRYYKRDSVYHIEGGDILNINDKLLAVGISQRTQAAGLDTLAQNLFSDDSATIETILAFEIPNNRAMMHLDTVFTQIDHDKFTIHPAIIGPLRVYEVTFKDGGVNIEKVDSTLEEILEKHMGMPITLIPCGAGDPIASQREQWNDGSNTLCIAPGTVVVYQRNEVTNAELRKHGIRVLEMPSAELSRGRGGPRCMSMPFWREDLK